jgi:hypothetical protein
MGWRSRAPPVSRERLEHSGTNGAPAMTVPFRPVRQWATSGSIAPKCYTRQPRGEVLAVAGRRDALRTNG